MLKGQVFYYKSIEAKFQNQVMSDKLIRKFKLLSVGISK